MESISTAFCNCTGPKLSQHDGESDQGPRSTAETTTEPTLTSSYTVASPASDSTSENPSLSIDSSTEASISSSVVEFTTEVPDSEVTANSVYGTQTTSVGEGSLPELRTSFSSSTDESSSTGESSYTDEYTRSAAVSSPSSTSDMPSTALATPATSSATSSTPLATLTTPFVTFSFNHSAKQSPHSSTESSTHSVAITKHPSSTLGTTVPPDMSASHTSPTTTGGLKQTDSATDNSSRQGSNPGNLAITLSAVLSVVGVLVLVGALFICLKFRKRRVRFLTRGVSPVDDDEIATWKAAGDEKEALADSGAEAGVNASPPRPRASSKHGMHTSTSSIKKPANVIVYNGRASQYLPGASFQNAKTSLDKGLPQTPIQAVAPNARVGLTDETIPGDCPFLPAPKRHPSRLSKIHPRASYTSPRGAHIHSRTRSSRSSTRSYGGGYNSDMELSPRTSNDYYSNLHSGPGHQSRIYSSTSIPPRLSLRDESELGGLSPRPLFREMDMIGRAIG